MKYIIFVCNGNTARSQMAEAFFRHYNRNPQFSGISAGIKPGKFVKEEAIIVMREKRIDISKQKPRLLTPEMSRRAEQIILMGCVEACPLTPPEKTIDWNLEDVSGKPLSEYRKIRDEIERKIKELLVSLE